MNRRENETILEKWRKFHKRNKMSKGYLLRKYMKEKAYKLLHIMLIMGLCFLIIQPILNKISVSFMLEKDLYDPTIISIPRNFTTTNYKLLASLIDYWQVLWNSTWISLLVSLVQVVSCTIVGYGFARFKFPLKNFWFACVILVIVVPPQTIMSSLYLNFRFFDILGIFKLLTGSTINLQNSILPYIMLCMGTMGLKSGLYIFMIRQYFRGVPKELEEAAYVDGCGTFSTFIRIMLPDAKPVLVSCFLFSFVWQWTDAFYGRMFLGKLSLLSSKLTAITSLLNDYLSVEFGYGSKVSIAYGQMMISTGMIMAIIPLLILYMIVQRSFVESLSQTGIKM
jgi:multiple sugar transport system permease protein